MIRRQAAAEAVGGGLTVVLGWAAIGRALACSARTARRRKGDLVRARVVRVEKRGRPPRRVAWAYAEDLARWVRESE